LKQAAAADRRLSKCASATKAPAMINRYRCIVVVAPQFVVGSGSGSSGSFSSSIDISRPGRVRALRTPSAPRWPPLLPPLPLPLSPPLPTPPALKRPSPGIGRHGAGARRHCGFSRRSPRPRALRLCVTTAESACQSGPPSVRKIHFHFSPKNE
jgi:hypothetical protein